MYIIYNRLTNSVMTGDIDEVKNEILKFLQVKIEARIEDTMIELDGMLSDIKRGWVGARDIDSLMKYSEVLKKTADYIMGYITIEKTASTYEDILNMASEYLAVEDFNESLRNEIEMLINQERYETANMLKKCKRETVRWVGFDHTDEYGSIICEVSE